MSRTVLQLSTNHCIIQNCYVSLPRAELREFQLTFLFWKRFVRNASGTPFSTTSLARDEAFGWPENIPMSLFDS